MVKTVALALVALATVACGGSTTVPFTDSDRTAIADSVLAGMRSYEAAIKALDVQKTVGHYTTAFRAIENEEVYSFEEWTGLVQEMLGSLRAYDGGFGEIHVNVLDRDVALADAPFLDVFTDSAGVVTRLKGTVTWVWVRTPEGWRIIHGHAYAVPDTTSVQTSGPTDGGGGR